MKNAKTSKAAINDSPPLSYDHPFWAVWKKTKYRVTAYSPDLTRVTGSLASGVLLSQILYWFGPSGKGYTKLRVKKNGRYWLAKSREEWKAETGLSFKQIKTAQDRLIALGIIEIALHLFGGLTCNHLRIDQDVLLKRLQALPGAKAPEELSEIATKPGVGANDFIELEE